MRPEIFHDSLRHLDAYSRERKPLIDNSLVTRTIRKKLRLNTVATYPTSLASRVAFVVAPTATCELYTTFRDGN